ncbi:SEC-C domain-containing protein [Candidatus Collierbacteria bacterium]|nr:SEC-C domain-containing protein [Candidatus Collierbacteria bacterium]
MTKKAIIDIPPTTEKDIARWNNLNPQNYERIIWSSIRDYNYKAQLDISEMLFKKLQELKKAGKQDTSLAKNISFRMMQLFFEASDQFALVFMSVINKAIIPVFETYVEGSNIKTKDFFAKCINGKIGKRKILSVWGLDKLKIKSISDVVMRIKMQTIVDDTVKKEKRNLKIYGKSYADYNRKTKKTEYSSSLKGSFSIKHGYKQISSNSLSLSVWKFAKSEPIIMEEIVEITRKDNNETKRVIKVGSLFNSKNRDIEDICKRILEHIAFLSREIQAIASIQLSLIDDPYGSLTLYAKNGILKIGRNESCPCNSFKKWKKCHGKY